MALTDDARQRSAMPAIEGEADGSADAGTLALTRREL
jgi:hypothetical protein